MSTEVNAIEGILSSLTHEGVPTTRVLQGYNGEILLGGYQIMRIDRASISLNRNLDIYPEVGRRAGVVYCKGLDIRVSWRRAFINSSEVKLAIGMAPDDFDPGKVYDSTSDPTLGSLLDKPNFVSERPRGLTQKNSYPIKTTAQFAINAVDNVPYGDGSAHKTWIKVYGLLIDSFNLNLGTPNDIIMLDPVEVIGEFFLLHGGKI